MTIPGTERVHLAAALDGAGWHQAAWREPDGRPAELLAAAYWADLVTEAERGLLDFVSIEDGLSLQSTDRNQSDGRTDRVRGRLEAVLIAARVAPLTSHIGLMPTVTVTHTEPFQVSKAIATLDWVSTDRAGIRVKVSGRQDVAYRLLATSADVGFITPHDAAGGGQSAEAAGRNGPRFAANYHVSPATVLVAVDGYRAAFKRSTELDQPYVIVSAVVLVAEDAATARELATGYGLWVRSIRSGEGAIEYPTPDDARLHTWTEEDRGAAAQEWSRR